MLITQPMKIRRAVCRCFGGAFRSASNISSINPMNGPNFGCARRTEDRYPGGSGCSTIFATVRQPNL
ncbi:MAG TPA: hypothetical protein VN636_11975 [Acidimicrobiia bacterium]|nr:hypothetical protein [Acidimicrobiia bacterium]